ncbi:zinc-dependent alcohol dehydrogenase family protein [Massiliimalia massiliensis]|uniref:zinc-dependent alcohol dehydrogenase family protein n=1 Tax=Massiliimalia massiliensis TaxID=1852384 RepID=UPI0009863ABE|nr:zinc-dependent alcohol dehydrogenase family protein [Massiliimalia massiliensis]
MKSAVFYGKHDLRLEERALPSVGKHDVLIKVMACGVCGTDVHIYEGDKGAAETNPPTILGHEFAGVVEQVGEAVTQVKVGDRVCVDPNQLCGKCYYCRSGIGHFCENMVGIGTTVEGGFAQYCAVNESQVYHLADTTPFEEGAMTEPVACCLHGIDLCEISAASTVMVIGGGMIGLLMVQLAKLSGAHQVILLEPVEGKREVGKKLGADLCIDPIHEDVKAVLAEHQIHRISVVIECAGLKQTIAQAIDLAGKYSIVMMFGLTKPDDEVAIKPFQIFQKEVILKASFINPYTQQRALDLINAKKIDVSSMVYEVRGLSGLEEVLANAELRKKGKFIIDPWKD